MDIIFEAKEDIKKGQKVILDFATGTLVVLDDLTAELQPKEQPNIIE